MNIGTKNIVILAVAMGLLASCADPIQERKGLMRSNGGNMKAIGAFLKTSSSIHCVAHHSIVHTAL